MAIAAEEHGADRRIAEPAAPTRSRPIVGWAIAGAGFLALTLYVFGAWLLDGPSPVHPAVPMNPPTYMRYLVRGQELLGFVIFPLFLYFQMVRPWRREGRITTTGLLCVALFLSTWQDPGLNFFNTIFTYNSYMWNLSSWAGHIPFWYGPNPERLAEPVLWNFFGYVYVWLGAALLGAAGMRWARRRHPEWSNPRLIFTTLVAFIAFDFCIELGWQFTGLDSYPGANSSLVIFPGHYYRLPILEVVLASPWWTGLACLLYFRDDRGRTLVERGSDRLGFTDWRQTFIRFLALTAVVNVIWLTYNIPASIVQGFYATPYPKDIMTRTYYVNDHCGPGTKYSCPWLKRPQNP
jgi:hypothetical protein